MNMPGYRLVTRGRGRSGCGVSGPAQRYQAACAHCPGLGGFAAANAASSSMSDAVFSSTCLSDVLPPVLKPQPLMLFTGGRDEGRLPHRQVPFAPNGTEHAI